MQLSRLHVRNYRGLKDVSIPLSPFVCITGENNAGKSSALQCLSLFLSGSTLKATDFFKPGNSVSIELTLVNITENDLSLLATEHSDRIRALLKDNGLTLVRVYGTDGKSQLGYHGPVPKEQRYSEETIEALLKGKTGSVQKDAVLAAFPELQGQITAATGKGAIKEKISALGEALPAEQKEIRFIPLPTGMDKSVLPMLPERIYIPAVKDLADDTKTAETSSFGKILAIVLRAIEPLLADEKDLFEKLSKKLTRVLSADGSVEDGRLEKIKDIEKAIERYVQESFANVRLEIEIPPPELKSVLSSARILADDGVRGPLELKGDGLRRAVVFSVLRAYVELARAETSTNEAAERGYLLLFEEPELFLHPDAQKILFDALGVFSKKHHVVVTTHSPLFLGPDTTATFIRLSKISDATTPQPFTKASYVDLGDVSPRDEFQIICFENNSAAFFSKRVVLVEGDSDFIVFPHVAQMLDAQWNCRSKSVAFIRTGGKGSISRYRSFFDRFDVPVFVIADLDCIDDGFTQLAPSDEAFILRDDLIQKADLANQALGIAPTPRPGDVRTAQASLGPPELWRGCSSGEAGV